MKPSTATRLTLLAVCLSIIALWLAVVAIHAAGIR